MKDCLELLEHIKNAPTIYVGCASDVYTRFSFECKEIEKQLLVLKILVKKLNIRIGHLGKFYFIKICGKYVFYISKEKYDLLSEVLL